MRLPYAAAVVEVPCNVPPRPSLLGSDGVSFIVVVMISPRGSPAELVDRDTDEELRSVKHEDEAVIEVPAEMSVDATGVATLQVVWRKGLRRRTWRVRVKVSVLLWRAESAGARK